MVSREITESFYELDLRSWPSCKIRGCRICDLSDYKFFVLFLYRSLFVCFVFGAVFIIFVLVALFIILCRDELIIPLLMETIPTPKEFQDAIESLSPEQQRFCRAFRNMQLASTLFGMYCRCYYYYYCVCFLVHMFVESPEQGPRSTLCNILRV